MPKDKNIAKRANAKRLPSVIKEKEIVLKAGRKGLYDEFVVVKVEELAAKGCTDKEIYESLAISNFTFYTWLNKYPILSHALKKYRGLADLEVENALFKNAVGYVTYERKKERRRLEDGSYGVILTEEIEKEMAGNSTAQIFYLKNRMPHRYKDKIETEISLGQGIEQMAFAIKRREE